MDLGKSDVRLASPRLTVCQTRSSPVPSGQKRRKASCDEIVPLKVEQGSPTSDAAQLVSNDSKRAQITPIPFSVETTGAQVLATKLPADLSGLPANLSEKNVSFHEALSASCPGVDDNDDVAPARDDDDALFRKLRSFLPDDKLRSFLPDASPRDYG